MEPLIASLLRPEAYDHPVEQVQLCQTHLSWILLTGAYAYKIKKPVDLGFVDFSSAERRRFFCQEELRLNQRLAPELYLGLCPVHGPPERASLHGLGPVIETAVRMRQFRQEDLLLVLLRHREATDLLPAIEVLATCLARFHALAPAASADSPYGLPDLVLAPALANLSVLIQLCGEDPCLLSHQQWCRIEGERLKAHFLRRREEGWVRECHGDLHLGNLVLHQGRLLPFDCLEFSPALRWVDVISEMAFLAMDLCRHRQRRLAAALLNHWLDRSGDYTGLLSWRWYVAYRAMVRAKVSALQLRDDDRAPAERRRLRGDLRAYLRLAEAARAPEAPVLLITHGVSGSGKSHLARVVARELGWLHLRSDAERLRLFGRWGETGGPLWQGDPYGTQVSAYLYETRLVGCCEAALEAGLSLICDATFLQRLQRRRFAQLAARLGARFLILPCSCPRAEALARIGARLAAGGDPSEADGAVLEEQLQRLEPLDARERAHCLPGPWDGAGIAASTAGRPQPPMPAPALLEPLLLQSLRQRLGAIA
jgi:hypothetical protein